MKFLYQPVKPFVVTQKFGENKACISLDGKKKVISCDGNNPPPGYKSLYGSDGHTAIDVRAKHGQEVYHAVSGRIYSVDTLARSGLDVRVEFKIGNDSYRVIYEHLLGYQGKVGDQVEMGTLVGWADNTGYSSGDHLHFVLMKLEGKNWVAIDPLIHMENLYALEALRLISKIKYLKEILARLLDNTAFKLRKQ